MMILKWTPLLILFHLSFFGLADPGFFKLNGAKLSPELLEKTNSIFRIVTRGPKPNFLVDHAEFAQYEQYIDTHYEGFAKWWQHYLFKYAKDHHLPVYNYNFAIGTAFVAEKSDILVTARHVIFPNEFSKPSSYDQARSAQEIKSSLENVPLALWVFNQDNQVVWTTVDGNQVGTLDFIFHGHPLSAQYLAHEVNFDALDLKTLHELFDFVALRVPKKLGVPLVFSTTPPAIDEKLISIGFPAASQKRFEEHHVPDSNGMEVRFSKGTCIEVQSKYRTFLEKSLPSSGAEAYIASKLFFDLDIVEGSSGSPIFNSQGQVVGIAASHFDHPGMMPSERYYAPGGYGTVSPFLLEWIDF